MPIDNSSSYCPAKVRETIVNLADQYLHSCCKGKIIKIDNLNDALADLDKQRHNMSNGIKDPSCDYCWNVEKHNNQSLRHYKIAQNKDTNDTYLELNVGNVCNFQCVYCTTKLSSKWNNDILKNGKYPIINDTDRYALMPIKTSEFPTDAIIKLFNYFNPKNLNLMGGEPFLNQATNQLLESVDLSDVSVFFSTNLTVDLNIVKATFSKIKQAKSVKISPSIDAIDMNITKFVRYGFDDKLFFDNLQYILKSTDYQIMFMPLITAHTVWDIENLVRYFNSMISEYGNRISARFSYLVDPKFQGFDILTDSEQSSAIELVENALKMPQQNITGLDSVNAMLKGRTFSKLLRKEQSNFLKEFSKRHKLNVPDILQRFL